MVNEKYLFRYLIDKLYRDNYLREDEIVFLLENVKLYGNDYLIQKADETRRRVYGDKVFMRGLSRLAIIARGSAGTVVYLPLTPRSIGIG